MHEVTTVADDEVVVFERAVHRRYVDLAPDTVHDLDGIEVRTLPRPGGELLCRVATANDVHFGEQECGIVEGLDAGPVLSVPEGATPYPVVMNEAAVAEIAELDPAAVLVKGDLTADGWPHEYDAFLACYGRLGDRMRHVRGNHDAYHQGPDRPPYGTEPVLVDLPGVRLAMVDTSVPARAGGTLRPEQLDWLDTVAAEADRPVLLFGHHHLSDPAAASDPTDDHDGHFGIDPVASAALVALAARRTRVLGYFAGHTHRNRVRRFPESGPVPFVEVACTKDFPGTWAEYRVYEGGVLQVHRRISAPEALAWSEQCRGLYGRVIDYASYALGELDDRCFALWPR